MSRIYSALFLWVMLAQVLLAGGNFIVLDSQDDREKIVLEKQRYEAYIQKDSTLKSLTAQAKIQLHIKQIEDAYILKVGPIHDEDTLALIYFKTKKLFPNAFILKKNGLALKSTPIIQTVEKKVYVDRKIRDKSGDDALWTALFGLAFIGILFMFLSSEQMKRMKREQEKIRKKHMNLELKQNEALSSMGENIQIIAKETMNHTHQLAEKVKETPLYEDVVKVMDNENELLDVTGDLVKFLRLKSKKVVIQHEVFNFNHVLNEVAGLLNTKHKENNIELVFDIDKDVPKNMFADSVNLGQVLINLLEYFIQNSQNKEVKIEVTTTKEKKTGLHLQFNINADINIEDKETLFDSYYDEEKRRYVGLGLFVAKELTYLMGGELQVKDRSYDSTMLVFTLPIEVKEGEKRKYRLPNKGLVGKKMLIVDRSRSSALATEKLFSYFKADIDMMSVATFTDGKVDFSCYEIVALSDTLFKKKVLEALEKVKQKQELKIISLENLFNSHEAPLNKLIDVRLKKPLTQEYVFDTLVGLYTTKEESHTSHRRDSDALRIYKDAFKSTENITLESFHSFSNAHILMVEDDVINQNIFMETLGKSNIEISLANNGEEALDFLYKVEEHIDMVFMDINMPIMDGYTAAKRMREDPRFDHTAIVFLTALASEHEIEKMLESGMNGYLSKPVQLEQLYTALKAFLNQIDPLISAMRTVEQRPMVFKGLNVEQGIENFTGNVVFYKQVLQEFLDAYVNSDTVFENLVKEKRYGQIKVLCLEMKGLTRTIGAKEMHTVINEIHQYLIYKKPELLDSYTGRYRERLKELIRSIEEYLSL